MSPFRKNRPGIHRTRLTRSVVRILATLVVFVTVYSLMLNGITLDSDTADADPGIQTESLMETEEESPAPPEENMEQPAPPEEAAESTADPVSAEAEENSDSTGQDRTAQTDPSNAAAEAAPETPSSPDDDEQETLDGSEEAPAEQQPEEVSAPAEVPAASAAAPTLLAAGPLKAPAADAIALKPYLSNVTISHRAKGDSIWYELDDMSTVQVGDGLRIALDYAIPESAMPPSKTVTYQMPDRIRPVAEDAGTVNDGSGNIIGTYSITMDGLITIVFSEDFGSGTSVSGAIASESSVDRIQTDAEGNIHIDFSDDINRDIHVERALEVTKTATAVDETEGTATYRVTVHSYYGTDRQPVTVTDKMLNDLVLSGDVSGISVKDKNGNPVSVTPVVSGDGKTITLQGLPAMENGEEYVIEYTSKVTDYTSRNAGNLSENNTVTATTPGGLSDTDTEEVVFHHEIIGKSGELSEDKQSITWKVTLNQSKTDISGWTLTDSQENVSVTITGSNGAALASDVPLPYTFPAGSTDTYTVTYTTPVEGSPLSVSNTATLTPPAGTPGNPAEDGAVVYVGEVFDKKAAGVSLPEAEDGTALFQWKTAFTGPIEVMEKYNGQDAWVYSDELWNENIHWMTGVQIKDLYQEILSAGFSRDQSYRPVVTKTDKNGGRSNRGQGATTYYDYDTETLQFKNGAYKNVLGWNINVRLNDGMTFEEDLVITESLPEGVKLLDPSGSGQWQLSVSFDAVGGFNGINGNFNNIHGDCAIGASQTMNGVTATRVSEYVYTITIPRALAQALANNNKSIGMELRAQVQDEFTGSLISRSYPNTVTVSTGGSKLGEATQTQVLTVPDSRALTLIYKYKFNHSHDGIKTTLDNTILMEVDLTEKPEASHTMAEVEIQSSTASASAPSRIPTTVTAPPCW